MNKKKEISEKIVDHNSINNFILDSKKMENKGFKLNLKGIGKIVMGLSLMILIGFGGYVAGKYQIDNVKDFSKAVKTELAAENGQGNEQTINRFQPQNKNVDMSLFWEVWDQLEKNYLFPDEVDYQKMVYGAAVGMTQALGDPYTAFFPPQENKTSKENLNGSFYGVGIQLGYLLGDQVAVMAPLTGMPAEKAGVRAGDYILKISDEAKGIDKDTYGMSLMEAVELIRGEKGTKVKLTLLHEGASESYEVEIVRDEITVPSVAVEFGEIINGEFSTEATESGKLIAHLELNRFGELTDEQWDKAIDEIVNQKNLAGVVLDLRNNPGGLVTGAVNLAAEFLPRGKAVVKQEERGKEAQTLVTERFGRLNETPLVVLINKGSASASEILGGALREHSRAKLVGTSSFGKGTMQSAFDMPDGSGAGLHITIARWLTPKGNWIHKQGINPDIVVELDETRPTVDTQLVKASEMLMDGSWKITETED